MRLVSTFTKTSLSARKVPREVVPLPFDLTWSELRPALPSDWEPGESGLVATRRLELQGLRGRGRSTLLSIECRTAVIDLFVKIAHESERDRHPVLEREGVPVPQLLAHAVRADGQVVLVYECLDTIGIDVGDPTEVGELIQVAALLNAVQVDADLAPLPAGQPEAEFTETVRLALHTVIDLGLRPDLDVEAWMEIYDRAKARCGLMPRSLTHGEFYFQQVGRRNEGPLVVFDLATVGCRPRFSDVCNILAPLATGAGESELSTLGRYLRLLKDAGVSVPAVDAAFLELRWLRALSGFETLPWLTKSYTDPDIGIDQLEALVVALERDVVDLNELG